MTRGTGGVIVALVGLFGCGDQWEPPELPIRIVTERFEIAPDFEGEPCAGNVPFMEERLAALEALLGVEVEGKIRYYWLENTEHYCPHDTTGCVSDDVIVSNWGSFAHELVHAAASPLGRASPFLEEGLAVAFQGTNIAVTDGVPSELLGDRPSTSDIGARSEFYAVAGHFVRFLYEEYGSEKLIRLYRASEYDDSEARLRGLFAEVYGLSFDELEAHYMDAAFDAYPPAFGCPEPTLVANGETFVEEVVLECADPRVLRVRDDVMVRPASLWLAGPTFGALNVDGEPESSVDRCADQPYDLSSFVPGRFDAGTHTVEVAAKLDAPRTAVVEFVPR
jgi:hypothetical protein